MKTIELTQGQVALVDDEDYDRLMKFKWHAHRQKKGSDLFYAIHTEYVNPKFSNKIMMHKFIMNCPDDMIVDHKDHDPLNNQKYNLRICTHKENNANKTPIGISKYLGAFFHKSRDARGLKPWAGACCTTINGKRKQFHLGYFETEEEAALSYDIKAKEIHGEFANLNFKS